MNNTKQEVDPGDQFTREYLRLRQLPYAELDALIAIADAEYEVAVSAWRLAQQRHEDADAQRRLLRFARESKG
jgi:hypothetical protein